MEFTKGEWKIAQNKGKTIWIEENVIALAKIEPWMDNGVANAHLIAAAPDMYEALKEITAQFGLVDRLYSRDREIIAQADKALLKAEGK